MAAVVEHAPGPVDVESGGAPKVAATDGGGGVGGESKATPAGVSAGAGGTAPPKGTPRFVNPDKTLAEGEEPFSDDDQAGAGDARTAGNRGEERDTYADIDPNVYRRLRPAGKAIARILDEAMYPEPEEEPIYYWDEEYEGDPEELTSAQIAFHNAHWAGYRAVKGAETVGEFFAGFLGINQSRYQWVIDSKRRDDERQKQEELENRQRRWLIAQAKLRRESMLAKKEGEAVENLEGGVVGGSGSDSSDGDSSDEEED